MISSLGGGALRPRLRKTLARDRVFHDGGNNQKRPGQSMEQALPLLRQAADRSGAQDGNTNQVDNDCWLHVLHPALDVTDIVVLVALLRITDPLCNRESA